MENPLCKLKQATHILLNDGFKTRYNDEFKRIINWVFEGGFTRKQKNVIKRIFTENLSQTQPIVITKENVEKINCKIVAELANSPTTPEADEKLFKNGILVIPDFYVMQEGLQFHILK